MGGPTERVAISDAQANELAVNADGSINTGITTDGSAVSVQNPLPTNGDSVYVKDLNLSRCTTAGFTGGTVEDLFNDIDTTLTNASGDNPKTIELYFKRPVSTSGIALGDTNGGTHSNIKVEALRGGDVWFTLNDNSASAIPFNSRFYSFSVASGPNETIGVVSVTALRITFNTADSISLSSITLDKTRSTQSSLIGLKPDGTTTYIGASRNSNLNVSVQEYGDTPAIDAFARLRTSAPFTIFDSKQLHDKQPLFWDEEVGGSATSVHDPVNAEVKMTVTANAADYVIRQTKQRFNYQPGKSQFLFMTMHSPQSEGVTSRIGCFDGTGVNDMTPNNGIFFECDGDISWNIAKNGTTTEKVLQANWNVDPLDGTGPSGISLDLTDSQILVMDFEWLGVGRVRVGFVIDGLIYYCHYFNHANNGFSSVYMSTPNLPLRYDVQSDGTGSGGHLDHICSTVMSEGGIEKTGVLRSADTGVTHLDVDVDQPSFIVGIRLKDAYLDVTVTPEFVSIINEQNDDFRWSLCLNPTYTGTVTWSDLADSAVQVGIGATANNITDFGIEVAVGYASIDTLSVSQQLQTALRIGSTIAGDKDELAIVVTPLSSGADIQGSLNFRELL